MVLVVVEGMKIFEDDEDGDDEHPAGTTSKGSQRRFSLPPWLSVAFKDQVEEANKRGDLMPKLYSVHKTFWFPQQSPYFLLQKASVSPQDLYNPRFFLWDPECLVMGGIGCPKCSTKLHRHGHASRPRCVVGLNETFWIIGYRYYCSQCVNPVSGKKTVTFRSWDPTIIERLPVHLALEFPAQLSHRSGITLSAFHFMRSYFQNGMGAKQFSDGLRVQHLRKYDEHHLQYLHAVQSRQSISKWKGQTYAAFLPFEDQSPLGLHGFVPSSQWLRDIYHGFIEKHEKDFHQHTSMLSGEICALDHSHKVNPSINFLFNLYVSRSLKKS